MRIHDSETNKCKKKLMLEPKEFEQGIEYALANDCDGLQIDTWNIDDDAVMDFKLFEKVANQIVFLSITNINTTNVANFEYIYSLERLETFYCQQVDLHIDFTRFSSLRNIGIFYNKNFLNLDKLEQLESAVISKLTEKDMSLFSNWKSIKTLHIYQSQIECLKGIEDLIQIDTLVFAHNRKLIDISSINRLDYIGEVSFEKNSKLRDYSVLADNQNIHNLFISDLDDLKFIQSMKSLLSFRFWNCKNGDLSPLLGNPILKDVYFTPNKKHYSHTLEQIKILITKRDNAYSVPHLTLILKGNTMIPDKLKDDFNSLRNMFDELKREIDKNVVKEENYKGEFYEIAPYSYQRNRFKQGKIVGNVTSLKTTNNLFTYYFDAKNQIIEIREGLELKNQFYYTFFIYEKELMDTLQHSFDYKPNGELKFIILSTELYSETIYQET